MKQQKEHLKTLIDMVFKLAEARQATVNETTLTVYAEQLYLHEPDDVRSALTQLAVQPREQYKPALPALGDVITQVKLAGKARRKRARGTYEPCGRCRNGRIFVNEKGQRYDPARDIERYVGYCECWIAWLRRE